MNLLMISLPAAKHLESMYTWAMYVGAVFMFVLMLVTIYSYLFGDSHPIRSALCTALALCLLGLSMYNVVHDSNEQSYTLDIQACYVIQNKTGASQKHAKFDVETTRKEVPFNTNRARFNVQKLHWWNWL